ncbi:hypothetical protein D9611_005277 [Ephemerocybe angulata]|uniref:Utp14-domain-containing protein n=1 Tax=Ephemerocybe angulata TaxID=980116 RepID=A0A8H5FDD9_9AGAR|nr:hypothetical protein D9611_005277 [Tulosesus angulatus]
MPKLPSTSRAGPPRKSGPGGPKKAFSKSAGDKSKANAEAGFAKRQTLKDKKQREAGFQDVYEYLPEKTRRSKVKMDLDRDEAMEFGALDEMGDAAREALRARLIGENEDDERVASEDDEEVDSDAAFEESDEERFAEFFPKKGKKSTVKKDRGVRFADVNLDEDDDEQPQRKPAQESEEEEEDSEAEGEDDEFIDLLDVLDGKGDIDMGSDDEAAKKAAATSEQPSSSRPDASEDEDEDMEDDEEISEDDEEDDEDVEDDEDDAHIAASDEEDLGEDALDNLQSFVSGLDTTSQTQKRKAADDSEEPARARKRRIIREKTETGVEDEFRIDSSGSKLNLDDLLAPLATQSSSLQTLKKSTKILGSSKTKALSAPLPQRAQERLDREAAYEQTKEEVDKWSGTMKKIREAEHLSFPLQAEKAGRVSNMELTAKFKPTTGLESAVDALLRNAKMRDEDLHGTEESLLKANNLTVEEVAQRRSELRKMRELMLRAELKAARANKIKSKTYRKLRRKEKERLAEQIDEEEDSGDEEVQAKKAMERARERATLKHKHTGKWAKQMQKGHMDVDQRKEIQDMLSRGEKLRKKVQGVGSDDSEESSSEEEGMDEEEAAEKVRSGAFEELRALREAGGDDLPEGKKGKGIFQMKFMKDAMARQEAAVNRDVDDFIKELGPAQEGESDVEDDEDDHDPSSGVVVHRAGGRVVYRPGASSSTSKKPSLTIPSNVPPPSDTSSVTLRSTDFQSPPPLSPVQPRDSSSAEANPWLMQTDQPSSIRITKKNEVVVSKESKSADKSKNKLKKETKKREEEKVKAKDDAELEISTENVLTLQDSAALKQKKKAAGKKAVSMVATAGGSGDSEDEDANSEVDAQEAALLAKAKGKGKAGPGAFQQRDLVALAFAGDNVIKEFEEAKKREIAEDAPKEVDTTIPGWGTWGGAGTRKKPAKPKYIKKIAGVDPTTRADYNKKHIIISEKRDKKASKYMVKDLPYPYSSQAQFEKAMERPLGVQWNTRTAFQRATLPRVVKKPGVVITPLEKRV